MNGFRIDSAPTPVSTGVALKRQGGLRRRSAYRSGGIDYTGEARRNRGAGDSGSGVKRKVECNLAQQIMAGLLDMTDYTFLDGIRRMRNRVTDNHKIANQQADHDDIPGAYNGK